MKISPTIDNSRLIPFSAPTFQTSRPQSSLSQYRQDGKLRPIVGELRISRLPRMLFLITAEMPIALEESPQVASEEEQV
jgi:hypothetical protein